MSLTPKTDALDNRQDMHPMDKVHALVELARALEIELSLLKASWMYLHPGKNEREAWHVVNQDQK